MSIRPSIANFCTFIIVLTTLFTPIPAFAEKASMMTIPLRDINFENPQFTELNLSTAEENIKALIKETDKKLNALVKKSDLSPENWLTEMDAAQQPLHQAATLLSHLNNVYNSDELNAVYQKILPHLSRHATKWGHSKPLYEYYRSVERSTQPGTMEHHIAKDAVKDFTLSGIHLNDQDKKTYKKISEKLTLLENKFEQNLLDCTKAWSKLITDKQQLSGIPAHAIEKAAAQAQAKHQTGWLLTLDYPCYDAVMTYADNRDLRKMMHDAYVTRASTVGNIHPAKYDNAKIMLQILELRNQEAKLLGFKNYGEVSLYKKMAKNPETVFPFLEMLREKCLPKAKEELNALTSFAKASGFAEELQPWDVGYYSEKLYQKEYAVSQEALRPYFPESVVLAGMFTIVGDLFDIDIKPVTGQPVWDPGVKLYAVHRKSDGVLYGHFYVDLYARPNKQSGAWVSDWINRFTIDAHRQYPVVFLQANFTQPLEGKPSLLTHDEVVTLFHEFGHTLHHVLTTVPYPSAAGGHGVPWDGIELPSQLLEYWAWQTETLPLISKHIETGEPLPMQLVENLQRAKLFQSALGRLRQLQFALFDMQLHTQESPAITSPEAVQAVLDAVRAKTNLMPTSPLNRFQNSFTHIFGGGYAAGYYSYQWAESLASDAFQAFKEKGVLSKEVGQKYRDTILAQGGSRDFMELYELFRGRQPTVDALLMEYHLN